MFRQCSRTCRARLDEIIHSSGADVYISLIVRNVHDMRTSHCLARSRDGSSAQASGDGTIRLDVYVNYKLRRALMPLYWKSDRYT